MARRPTPPDPATPASPPSPPSPIEPEAPAPAPPLLPRPPEEGARLLALDLLDQAAAAHPRLGDDGDPEALHDFRVALRRLRSCLRAYQEHMDESVPGKLSKRLRRLAGATGAGRDTEVQIEWLRGEGPRLGAYHRAGWSWLLARLEERRSQAYREILEEVKDPFGDLESALRRRLSVYRTEVRLDEPGPRETLGQATAKILRRQAADLAERLGRIETAGDEDQAHQARIAAKRLRYLLEPLDRELPRAKPVVRRLKALQDLLGELHDAHVLEAELAAALADATRERAEALFELTVDAEADEKTLRAAQRRNREAGLLRLVRLNRDRRDRLFATFEETWLQDRGELLLGEVDGLGETLASSGPSDPS